MKVEPSVASRDATMAAWMVVLMVAQLVGLWVVMRVGRKADLMAGLWVVRMVEPKVDLKVDQKVVTWD